MSSSQPVIAALFFFVMMLMSCAIIATFNRLRARRRMALILPLNQLQPGLQQQQEMPARGLRTASPETPVGTEVRRAWQLPPDFNLSAAEEAAMAARIEQFLATQQRISEMQQADEERALAHAVESSLSSQSSAVQLSVEEKAVEKALEVHAYMRAGPHKTPTPFQPAITRGGAPDSRAQDSIVSSVLALPTQKWSDVREGKTAPEDEECALCMEPFTQSDEVRVLKCRHYFHTKCIDQWLVVQQKSKSRSCPLCQISPI